MADRRLNSVRGMFSKNQKNNPPKKKVPKRYRAANKQKANANNLNQFANMDPKQLNLNKQKPAQKQPLQNQQEMSEMDRVLVQRMREIENTIGKLVADVQYLDSKNPAVSAKMTKMLVEMINTLWNIGNIAINYQKNNQLSLVDNQLKKQEQRILKIIEDPKKDSVNITNELNEVKMCQKIINDSLRPINSTVEYYNIIMSKLTKWGFEIKNPIGQKYDAHIDIDILAFEDADPNLKEPTITETKKPEIYLNNKKIQKAQVVVTKAGAKK
jgi:hypothetical protein